MEADQAEFLYSYRNSRFFLQDLRTPDTANFSKLVTPGGESVFDFANNDISSSDMLPGNGVPRNAAPRNGVSATSHTDHVTASWAVT